MKQKNKLCETLQIATTKAYTAKRNGGTTRLQGKIKMESSSLVSAIATAPCIEMFLGACVYETKNLIERRRTGKRMKRSSRALLDKLSI